jgi:ferrochelatase
MLSEQLLELRTRLTLEYGQKPPVVFTTHSLPEAVVRRDPTYLDQLTATMEAVAARAELDPSDYVAAYQSAGHTPEPWLKPDLNDVVADLKGQNIPGVIIVPIQFLADHLEILYDLDTAAREETEALGVYYHRLPVANLNPLFIETLADIIIRENI